MTARIGPGAFIKGILGVQLAIGLMLVAGDMADGWQGLGLRRDAPRLDQPVRPGDQTRRYRPGDLPAATPGRPFPETGDMPERLSFAEVQHEGEPALRLTGQIAPGDAGRLADRLEAAGPVARVLLHSPGGSVPDALEIGRFLREAGIATEVAAGDVCLSACPYILAGGARRFAGPGAHVGVHQHYFGENSVQPAFMAVEDIQRGQGEVMSYLSEMGIDPLLMQHALVTPPDQIYILLPEEMQRYGLVTPAEN